VSDIVDNVAEHAIVDMEQLLLTLEFGPNLEVPRAVLKEHLEDVLGFAYPKVNFVDFLVSHNCSVRL
jgi:hypothetical protein